MSTPSLFDELRALHTVYAKLPALDCKGLCAHSCRTPLDMTDAERARIEAIIGMDLPDTMWQSDGACPLLTVDGTRCGVHRIRPMICRLWGMAKNPLLRCPHGCEPGRWLTDVEVVELLLDSHVAGGAAPEVIEKMRELLRVPSIAALATRWIAGEATPQDIYDAVRSARDRS